MKESDVEIAAILWRASKRSLQDRLLEQSQVGRPIAALAREAGVSRATVHEYIRQARKRATNPKDKQ